MDPMALQNIAASLQNLHLRLQAVEAKVEKQAATDHGDEEIRSLTSQIAELRQRVEELESVPTAVAAPAKGRKAR